jgi:hypothetical protein
MPVAPPRLGFCVPARLLAVAAPMPATPALADESASEGFLPFDRLRWMQNHEGEAR